MLRHKGWCFYALGLVLIALGTYTLTRVVGYSFLVLGIGTVVGAAIWGMSKCDMTPGSDDF